MPWFASRKPREYQMPGVSSVLVILCACLSLIEATTMNYFNFSVAILLSCGLSKLSDFYALACFKKAAWMSDAWGFQRLGDIMRLSFLSLKRAEKTRILLFCKHWKLKIFQDFIFLQTLKAKKQGFYFFANFGKLKKTRIYFCKLWKLKKQVFYFLQTLKAKKEGFLFFGKL